MFIQIVSRIVLGICIWFFSPHAVLAKKHIRANSAIEAAMKVKMKGVRKNRYKRYSYYSDHINQSTAKRIDSLLVVEFSEWKAAEQDTMFFSITDIGPGGNWWISIYTLKYKIYIWFRQSVPKTMNIYLNNKHISIFDDIVRNWNVNAFRTWKTTTIKDREMERVMRIISIGKGRYEYEFYDLYDNSELYEYVKDMPIIYRKRFE